MSRLRWLTGMAVAFLVLGSLGFAQNANRTLKIGVGAPPVTMDPMGSDSDSNMSIVTNIFDALIQRDQQGKLQPDLATSWKNVDPTTWQFTLRKGVTFSNGDAFTWKDVQYTFQRLKEPKISEFGTFGALVKSVQPVDGDPWTIDITTTQPVPYFLQNLPLIFIMGQKSTEARSQGQIGTQPIGTGPYVLDQWVKGSYLKLSANPHYWGDAPAISHVEIRPITDPSARLAAVLGGEVDILQNVPVALAKQIQASTKVDLLTHPARRSIFLGLGNKPGTPGADMRVRKAIAMAIDEKAIIDKVMFGHATPAAQIPDPPTVGYSSAIQHVGYDPAQAKKLLQEAGYGNGFSLTLSGTNDHYVQDANIMAAIASQLAKVGIKVDVNAMPASVYFPKEEQHNLQLYLLGWFDSTYDFGRTYSKLIHAVDAKAGLGTFNGGGYDNPTLDAEWAKANALVAPKAREAALKKLNEDAMADLAVIPLHYQEDDYAVSKTSHVVFDPRPDTWLVLKGIHYAQ
ncbi:MAG: ABC transporter substrate-binding protein [Deinococcales bacterium]